MAPVHPSAAQGFSAKADIYARGRPDYPASVDRWLKERLGLAPGRTAIDLGAGTGKFTPRLIATGARTVAVEPVPEMSAQLTARLGAGVEVLKGTADAIPMADSSVDAIVCAQSFHWFATPAALGEIRRVLKPGGKLGLVWNERDERVAWVAKLVRILAPFEGDTPRYHKGDWRRVFPFDGLSPLVRETFPHGHRGTPETVILDRVLSTSFIAALPAAQQANVAAEVRALIAGDPDLAGKAEINFPYETAAYHCEKLGSPAAG